MKQFLWIMLVTMLFACGSNTQDEANKLLEQANEQFKSHQYDKALHPHPIRATLRLRPTCSALARKAVVKNLASVAIRSGK